MILNFFVVTNSLKKLPVLLTPVDEITSFFENENIEWPELRVLFIN